jgi:hypothetical protein
MSIILITLSEAHKVVKLIIQPNRSLRLKLCALTVALTIILTTPLIRAQAAEDTVIAFSPADQFAIPNYNGSISFAAGGSYESATLYDNGTWHFAGLALNSYTLNLSDRGAPPGGIVTGRDVLPYLYDGGAFSVSAKDCNVTITAYEPLTQYNPYSGWLNYTVTGTGEQIFDLNFPSRAFYWNITIDGEMKIQNESWTQSNNNLIKVTGARNNVCIRYDSIQIPRDGPQTAPFWLQVATTAIVVTLLLVVVMIFLKRNSQHHNKKVPTISSPKTFALYCCE